MIKLLQRVCLFSGVDDVAYIIKSCRADGKLILNLTWNLMLIVYKLISDKNTNVCGVFFVQCERSIKYF